MFALIMHQTDFCYSFLAELGADELSKVPFPMFCLVCGFHPLILFFDGNRKSNFKLRGINTSKCLLVITFHFLLQRQLLKRRCRLMISGRTCLLISTSHLDTEDRSATWTPTPSLLLLIVMHALLAVSSVICNLLITCCRVYQSFSRAQNLQLSRQPGMHRYDSEVYRFACNWALLCD